MPSPAGQPRRRAASRLRSTVPFIPQKCGATAHRTVVRRSGHAQRQDSPLCTVRAVAGWRALSAIPSAGEPSFQLVVSHWATPKERRDGTIARPSEDAFLFSPFALGVCDGVGGWEARGINSGAYSRSLCEGAARALQDAVAEARLERMLRQPLLLLQAGYRHACDQKLMGSSTALVRVTARFGIVYSYSPHFHSVACYGPSWSARFDKNWRADHRWRRCLGIGFALCP